MTEQANVAMNQVDFASCSTIVGPSVYPTPNDTTKASCQQEDSFLEINVSLKINFPNGSGFKINSLFQEFHDLIKSCLLLYVLEPNLKL